LGVSSSDRLSRRLWDVGLSSGSPNTILKHHTGMPTEGANMKSLPEEKALLLFFVCPDQPVTPTRGCELPAEWVPGQESSYGKSRPGSA
jgi:hypothetical protein